MTFLELYIVNRTPLAHFSSCWFNGKIVLDSSLTSLLIIVFWIHYFILDFYLQWNRKIFSKINTILYRWPAFENTYNIMLHQYGTVYKRPENRVHSRNSAIHKIIMHCYLGPIVVHFLSTCDCLGFYMWIHRSLGVKFCT